MYIGVVLRLSHRLHLLEAKDEQQPEEAGQKDKHRVHPMFNIPLKLPIHQVCKYDLSKARDYLAVMPDEPLTYRCQAELIKRDVIDLEVIR